MEKRTKVSCKFEPDEKMVDKAVRDTIAERKATMDKMYRAFAAHPSAHNQRRLEIAMREYQELVIP